MSSAQSRRTYLRLCQEFVTTTKNVTREVLGRTYKAVNVSQARMAVSDETIRRSLALLNRQEQRLIDAEAASLTVSRR